MPSSVLKVSRLLLALVMTTVAIAFLNATPNASFAQDGAPESQTPEAICESVEVVEPETRRFARAEQVIEADIDYQAIFCTGNGPVYVDLYEQYTPVTVNNFVFLAEQGYYNNSTFHRVIADFMAQGGDPVGNPVGTGGPGYQFQDEFAPFLAFSRPGLLAMANAGPGTNGSQFFITRVPTPHLNNAHTIFGEVLQGQEVIDSMTNTEGGNDPEALDTVVIIEDPSTVEATIETREPATAEEALRAVEDIFAGDPTYTAEARIADTAEDAAARFTTGSQEALAELYTANNFNFEAGGFYGLSDCEIETPLLGIGFWLTNWGSAADARNFVTSDQLNTVQEELGFNRVEDPAEVLLRSNYTTDLVFRGLPNENVCDTRAILVRHIWNLNSYTVEMSLLIDETFFGGDVGYDELPAIMANLGYELTPVVADILLNSGE